MPNVELVNLSKVYGRGQRVVDRVSLQVEDGEFLVLVGPSGCGKTTLLRMVAGLEDITEGEVRIGGRVVNEVPPKDRDIAMVFQNYALYPHMSAYENMAFGLRLRKLPRADVDRTVRETAALLGLERKLERKPRELSGGERQRVALGRAMVRHPKVFLFDEPLSNLDAKLRVAMRAEINRLHQRIQTTMIYVTHDQVEAMTLGDRIAVLRSGMVQQVADPFTLYHKPANVFVAGFMGSPPMNFFTASVPTGGPPALEVNGASVALPAELGRALEPLRGGVVTVGVRPEDLSLQPGAAGGRLDGRVELREPLGNEVLVHWRTPAGLLVSRVAGDAPPSVGDAATLHFAFTHLHFFDPKTERALDGAAAKA